MPRRDWTKDELIVAFNLYCRIPFGRIHIRNPEIIELANSLDRTPSSVSWKLANFARLDPALQRRNIKGASHGSRAEEEVWAEFHQDWDSLAFQSQRLLARLKGAALPAMALGEIFPEGTTRDAVVKARVNQAFFRSAVLAAYDCKCCVTGLATPELLTASHIVPWSVDAKNRTNPRNGLCLNALHDKAFDCGLMTIMPDFRIRLSKVLKTDPGLKDGFTKPALLRYDGKSITLPDRFTPDLRFLEYHNRNVFWDESQ